jgi:hypothetical protein
MSDIIRSHQKKGDTAGLKMGTHKSRAGGLTQAGRDKVNRETGSNLKAPQPEGGARKKSFCARSRGWTGERGKLARKRWAC